MLFLYKSHTADGICWAHIQARQICHHKEGKLSIYKFKSYYYVLKISLCPNSTKTVQAKNNVHSYGWFYHFMISKRKTVKYSKNIVLLHRPYIFIAKLFYCRSFVFSTCQLVPLGGSSPTLWHTECNNNR